MEDGGKVTRRSGALVLIVLLVSSCMADGQTSPTRPQDDTYHNDRDIVVVRRATRWRSVDDAVLHRYSGSRRRSGDEERVDSIDALDSVLQNRAVDWKEATIPRLYSPSAYHHLLLSSFGDLAFT